MTIERKKLRWNGWGWVDAPDLLGERADAVWEWLGNTLGVSPLPETPAKALEDIELPPIRLDRDHLERLGALTAPERVFTDDYERAFHARGKSYADLLAVRAGQIDPAPDAVVYTKTAEEVLAVVQFAAGIQAAVIPYGGGSSVVGGVNSLADPQQTGIVVIDLTLMDQVLAIDETARTARIQAGVYGPALEKELQSRGWTLGHYPQSFEFSTLGGWIAHRGAGQQSNKYGKAEKWLVSARLATPQGLWTTEGFPASAGGPQLSAVIPGSEGALGVITDAVVKIQPAPEAKDYRGYLFQKFEAGAEAVREIVQSGVPTAMLRLSDEDETFFFSVLRSIGKEPEPKVRFCVLLVGLEGAEADVAGARDRTRAIVEKHKGMHLGESPGKSWYEGRFGSPYLRDPMMDRGLGVDTLETATTWSNILPLHEAVTAAIRETLEKNPGNPRTNADAPAGLVMAHISHTYPDGASLYFTFTFARDLERPLDQWRAVKIAASEAIVAGGGTISHHHGVGTDHLPWINAEKGPIGIDVLKGMKEKIDPARILNPGKLIP